MSKVFTIAEGLENMGALRTGGQGSVYKGRRMGPIISAVKLLPTPIHTEDKDDKNFRNFQNEVEKLKKVNEVPNPNVVKILSSGLSESGSFPFIEMEYIEGPDLEELLKPPHDSLFTIKEVIKLADHLANALGHCHRVGVKHGDIKSNNVKFNIRSGNYVLLDFGLAIMSDEQRRTSMRHAGAIEFMAPEQNTGAMLFQTDIYSYGIILFELLTGQVPFPLHDNGETARNAVMIAHMETPVPDLLTLRHKNMPAAWPQDKKEREMQVPRWLTELVNKCLQKNPEGRYSNGLALQEAVAIGSTATMDIPVSHKRPVKAAVVTAPVIESGMMSISKLLFTGLMVLLAFFMVVSVYALFFKATHNSLTATPAKDSTNLPVKDTSAASRPVTPYKDRFWVQDSINKKAIQDDIDKRNQQQQDSAGNGLDTARRVEPPNNN